MAGLHPGTLATYVNARLDLLIVGLLSTTRQAGLYSLATNLAETLLVVTLALGQSVMRDQTVSSDEEAARITVTFVRRSWVLVLAAVAAVFALSYPFVSLVYGSAWHASVPPLMILSVAAVGLTIAGPFNVLMARLSRLRDVSLCATVAMLTNVVANLVLIPAAGIVGAALASVLSYWVYAALLLRLFHKVTGRSVRTVFAPLTPRVL
jgi:O-antigen/teichoic acid export membrane protein